jgi:hypothetical protein
MRKCDNAVVDEKFTCYENLVTDCIVIMEQPIARAPHFRSLSLNVLTQTVNNIAVELGVYGLAFGRKLKVTITRMSKNTKSMLLVALQICLAFGLGDPELFHCEDCCLVSGSYP